MTNNRFMTQKLTTAMILLLLCQGAFAQQKLEGIVRDENGEPMMGVGVFNKDKTSDGTVTGLDGTWQLTTDAKTLEFSFFGYNTLQEPVSGRTVINVTLQPKSTTLDEVVVIGYGTSKKGDLTGSVTVVDVEETRSGGVSNIAQALQGRIAGADFSSGTGELGESGTIQIRGTRSISAGNEPLIIVDGVIDAVASLNDINPEDITGISVLKDVSSTAIYGARGANGVILVTTDGGGSGSSKLNIKFNARLGVSRIANRLDLMDASELAEYRNLVHYSSKNFAEGTAPLYPDPSVYGKGTDWVGTLSRTGISQNYYLQLNGKADAFNYAASLGYTDEKGILIGSGLKRITGVGRFDAKLTKALDFGVRFSLAHTHADQSAAAISGTNSNAAIYLSPLLDESSTWNRFGADESYGGTVYNNPYIVATESERYRERDIINISSYLKYRLAKNFVADARYTLTRNQLNTYVYNPSTLPVAAYHRTGGSGTRSETLTWKHNADLTLTWKQTLRRRHSLEALAGTTFERSDIAYDYLNVTGVLNDKTGIHAVENFWDPAMSNPKSYNQYITRLSGFARFNYVYDRRYHLSATMRADGASNFSSSHQWGFFPSVAFRWSIINERWFRRNTWINDLSLRLSAGRAGNDAIAAYNSLAVISSTFASWMFGDAKLNAAYPLRLSNTDLTWETTDSYNAGLNFDILRNRLSIEADAYLSYTRDLLLSTKTGYVTGYGSYMTNAGTTRNMGVELTVKGVEIRRRNFEWSTALTLAHNAQVVVDADYDGIRGTYNNPRTAAEIIYGFKTGYPRNSLWGYQFSGVWKDQDEYNRNLYTHTYVTGSLSSDWSANAGRARYLDINHDGVLDQADEVYLGCSDPVLYGGIQNTFRLWKKLELGVYFSYSLGGRMYNLSEMWLGVGGTSYNHYRYMLDAWTPDNPDSDIPRADRIEYYCSDQFIHDASFLRLKTLSVSYDFDAPERARKYFKKINLGISADNLWLLKRYNGFDPDVDAAPTVAYRLDTGSLPRPTSLIGKVTFFF